MRPAPPPSRWGRSHWQTSGAVIATGELLGQSRPWKRGAGPGADRVPTGSSLDATWRAPGPPSRLRGDAPPLNQGPKEEGCRRRVRPALKRASPLPGAGSCPVALGPSASRVLLGALHLLLTFLGSSDLLWLAVHRGVRRDLFSCLSTSPGSSCPL